MQPGLHNKLLIPFMAFVLLGSVALLVWQHQNNRDRELVKRYVETSAEQVRIRVEGLMNSNLSSLELMADRWVERQPPDFRRQRFQGFATALVKHYPGYSGILWIDPAGVIQWVFPAAADVAVAGRGVADYLYPDHSTGVDIGTGVLVTPSALSPGGARFHAVRALMHGKELQGYLDGVFSVEQIMSLGLTRDLLNDFRIGVSEGNRTIYRHGSSRRTDSADTSAIPHATREIRFGPKTWTITLAPNQGAYPHGSNRNFALLAFGLTLSAALSLLLHLLMKRMEMYKASRDQAVLEVNERKKTQAALTENEKKLHALLAELTTKNAELESFVYTVSHDLKTPIVTIDGFIGALREDFGGSISATGEQYLRYMSDAARKMELLINDLLNLSRIGRLDEKKTSFSMDRPLKDAIATLRPQIEALGIDVQVREDLPVVRAVRKRIEQVLYNLLSNAVKYIGRDNADPRIDIGCMQQNSERVFWVRDNGIGIDHKYFEKIFQVFERLPPAKAAGEGTGIGLAIVKRIIEHHGGRIWLDSKPGKGTTFYFTLRDEDPYEMRNEQDLDRRG
jgi:signal transduction histidine kinase